MQTENITGIRKGNTFLVLTVLVMLAACQQKKAPDKKPATENHSVNTDYPELKGILNKKQFTSGSAWYMLICTPDSAVYLVWGKDAWQRVYTSPLDNRTASRFFPQWANQDYIILHTQMGSEAWRNIVLPISQTEALQEFDNAVCFDSTRNLLLTEGLNDTVLVAHHLRKKTVQYFTEKERPCSAANNDACLDSVWMKNKILYYRWKTPDKFEKTNKESTRSYPVKD